MQRTAAAVPFACRLLLLALLTVTSSAAPAGPSAKAAHAGGEGSSEGWSEYELSEVGNRGMIVVPRAAYPKGCNCTGILHFRFTVMPDGTITAISLVKPAAPELVKAAQQGLRRGRFRPLSKAMPQAPQQGMITYRFLLEPPGHQEEGKGG